MTTDALTEQLTAWLDDQPARASQHLRTVVSNELAHAPQARAWLVRPRNFPRFTPAAVRLVAVTAAIILAIGFGFFLGSRYSIVGPAVGSPTPVPSVSPRPWLTPTAISGQSLSSLLAVNDVTGHLYAAGSSSDRSALYYVTDTSGGWTTQVLVSGGRPSLFDVAAIAVDAQGTAWVAYQQLTCTPQDSSCGSWGHSPSSVAFFLTNNAGGSFSDPIALELPIAVQYTATPTMHMAVGDGSITVVYVASDATSLWYATNVSGSWSTSLVGTCSTCGEFDYALTAGGGMQVAWASDAGAVANLRIASLTSAGVFGYEEVPRTQAAARPVLRVTDTGDVHIAYSRPSDPVGTFIVDKIGGSWSEPDKLGSQLEIDGAFDPAGSFQFVYIGGADGALTYADPTSGTLPYPITQGPLVGSTAFLLSDSAARPTVVYLDAGRAFVTAQQ